MLAPSTDAPEANPKVYPETAIASPEEHNSSLHEGQPDSNRDGADLPPLARIKLPPDPDEGSEAESTKQHRGSASVSTTLDEKQPQPRAVNLREVQGANSPEFASRPQSRRSSASSGAAEQNANSTPSTHLHPRTRSSAILPRHSTVSGASSFVVQATPSDFRAIDTPGATGCWCRRGCGYAALGNSCCSGICIPTIWGFPTLKRATGQPANQHLGKHRALYQSFYCVRWGCFTCSS